MKTSITNGMKTSITKTSIMKTMQAAAAAALALAGAAGCTKNPDVKTGAPTSQTVKSAAPATAGPPKGPPKITTPKITTPTVCNLGPCHGLDDLTCTAGAPMMCTEIYKHGDFCRQFVKCEKAASGCALQVDPKFEQCKACMDGCKTDLNCDNTCRDQLGVE